MKMKKLATLGLGIMLTATVLTPVMASEPDTNLRSKKFEQTFNDGKAAYINFSRMEKSDTFNKEEYLNSLEDKLSKLEEDFAAGNINEDKYNVGKERITKAIEAIEKGNFQMMAMKKGFGEYKAPLSKEELLKELNTRLSNLETEYSQGNIEQEKYEYLIESISKRIEAIENGEYPVKGDFEAPTKEEILERLNKLLIDAETKLNNGDISEVRYNDYKDKIGVMIEKIESGEDIQLNFHFNGKSDKTFSSLTKEERIEMLQDKLAKLEAAFNEGELSQEKYDTAKESITNMIQALENSDETTDNIKNR